jgi:hypothetical protein
MSADMNHPLDCPMWTNLGEYRDQKALSMVPANMIQR